MEMIPVSSEAISAVGYDPATKTMRIRFASGREHDYYDTEPEEHQALLTADSIGRHFSKHIRHRSNSRVK